MNASSYNSSSALHTMQKNHLSGIDAAVAICLHKGDILLQAQSTPSDVGSSLDELHTLEYVGSGWQGW
jgi:hypothetical protein